MKALLMLLIALETTALILYVVLIAEVICTSITNKKQLKEIKRINKETAKRLAKEYAEAKGIEIINDNRS